MKISFLLNRDVVQAAVRANQTALDFLREDRALTGAKEACNEGDCGACLIAVGDFDGTRQRYRAMNSCLLPAARLHGKHVVTVEGLAESGTLHPVQQALLDHHGVQCGFCTSGFVMALFCLFFESPTPTREEILGALDGSLCRCTGYASILRAAEALAERCRDDDLVSGALCPAYFASATETLRALRKATPVPQADLLSERYHTPRTRDEYFSLMETIGDAPVTLLGGGTDVMVPMNLGRSAPERVVDISFLNDLSRIEANDAAVMIGARVTLTQLLENEIIRERFPALIEATEQMCSTPIRNAATLAGNLHTASPIADALPPLLVYDARVVLESKSGTRRLPVRDFILGYRKTALERGELIAAIEIPFSDYRASFEKTGKRKTLDIASVNSALAIRVADGRITEARLAYGGVAPMPLIAKRAEESLRGKLLTPDTVRAAARIAAEEVTPIDDVRGSAEFRRQLTENHLIKHFVKLFPSLFE